MKNLFVLGIIALSSIVGCAARGNATLGVVSARAQTEVHEWRGLSFRTDGNSVGVTLGVVSADVGGEVSDECSQLISVDGVVGPTDRVLTDGQN